jgi:signal transduction histidine kinase
VDNAHLYRDAQEARAAAEAANGLKDEFLATLSHELRTPLTAIVGWAHLLKRGKLSPDETARAVDTVIRNATAQNQIIDELLDVSRIITGKLQLDLRPVDIATIVKAAIGTVTPAASVKGIRLQLIQDAGSTSWATRSDCSRCSGTCLERHRVHAQSGGPHQHAARRLERRVVVADTGGHRRRFLPHVFDRFTQATRRARDARGLGLGLIARQSSAHAAPSGGEPGVDQGSTFTARFPAPVIPRSRERPGRRVGGARPHGVGCWSWRTTTTPGAS